MNATKSIIGPDDTRQPDVTICIPHYEVKRLMQLCLRAIRYYTRTPTCEVIVVDNGSKDDSLEWLRSVSWIKLIERGDETPKDWVLAMNMALDAGLAEARGRYYLIMHSDTIVKRDDWLSNLVALLEEGDDVASAGSGKLELKSRWRLFLKSLTDFKKLRLLLRRAFFQVDVSKRENRALLKRESAPRDYCAIYRTEALRRHEVSFIEKGGYTAGETAYRDLKAAGHASRMLPVDEMMQLVDHIAHATGALLKERELNDKRMLRKTKGKLAQLFVRGDVDILLGDDSLDR